MSWGLLVTCTDPMVCLLRTMKHVSDGYVTNDAVLLSRSRFKMIHLPLMRRRERPIYIVCL